MAISARDELKHLADSLTEGEAEVHLAAPELLAACRALLALVDGKPRQYQYDAELQAVVGQVRQAVADLPGTPPDREQRIGTGQRGGVCWHVHVKDSIWEACSHI